ncbi:hypothetical protein KR084_012906, partial [Drosophila pseudotakahashii]
SQCGQYCLTKLHPMIDLIPEAQIKLNGIQGEQRSIQTKLVAMQSRLEAQRIQIQNSFERMPAKEDFESGLSATEGQLQALESKIKDQHTETQEQLMAIKLEMKNRELRQDFEKIQEHFDSRLYQMEDQLLEMKTTLQGLQNKLGSQKEELQDAFRETLSTTTTIPPKFEKIGQEYYYIEKSQGQTWDTASSICRQMGGYLASFRDKKEVDAVRVRLPRGVYWIGANDREYEEFFISDATGSTKSFMIWNEGEPNNKDKNEDCVVLTREGFMNDTACSNNYLFICKYYRKM